MNIIDKQHYYFFNNINISSNARIYVNTINSRSYDLGSYDKTLIIVHEFMYKYDYMMSLIDKIVKSNTRVIAFDLTGHNCTSEIYKKFGLPIGPGNFRSGLCFDHPESNVELENSTYQDIKIPNDYKMNSKFLSKKQNHYDFVDFEGISILKKILGDYGLLNNKDENIFILSHSIGSLNVFSSLLSYLGSWSNKDENIIKGIICLSPNLKDLRFQNKIFYNLLSFFWPGKLLNCDLKLTNELEKSFLNDSKGRCTARSIKNIVNIQDLILKNAVNITVPSLIFHAKDDQISSYDDSLNFFNELNTDEKEFITYDKGGHNLFIGDKSQEVINKINSWMIEKL